MNCSPPSSSVHGIFQGRILECVIILFSRGSSLPRDQTWVFWITDRFFIFWAIREAPIKKYYVAIFFLSNTISGLVFNILFDENWESLFTKQDVTLIPICKNVLYIYIYVYAAAAAKSLQLCPTLCNPIDSSPSGSTVPGILQARTLEWVAISFSNAWK